MLGVVVSRADTASVSIGQQLQHLADWERHEDGTRPDATGGGTVYRTAGMELREFDPLHLELESPAAAFDSPDLVVFASRHSGETGPLLTAHHTGNVGPAEYGGEANAFARACPNAHRAVLSALAAHAPEGYEVGTECTHHGPTAVGAPSMFVEVGSARPQWTDADATRAVARAILALRGVEPDAPPEGTSDADGGDRHRRHLLGIGGGHYAPRFERVVRETDWAVGHVLADWGLETLDTPATVLERAFEQSNATYALLDDRPELAATVEDLGYRAVSETWVRETTGVDLDIVSRLEAALTPVDAGLRFGDPARDGPTEWTVASLPDEVLAETFALDRERTLTAVTDTAVAFETEEGGTRPTGDAAFADERDRERLLERLLGVLEAGYDSVERQETEVVVREEAFDPDLARTLGVPEGPAFGRLADGEPVEVDGESIPPEAVTSERERRLSL
jgi:D-aminoacyl-tRNA deacylase